MRTVLCNYPLVAHILESFGLIFPWCSRCDLNALCRAVLLATYTIRPAPSTTIIATAINDPSPWAEPWVIGAAPGVSLGVSDDELVDDELLLTLVPTRADRSESLSNEASTPVLFVQAEGGVPLPETNVTAAHCR